MFPFYFRRRHSKVDDDVEAITAKRDPAGPPRVLPRGHLGKKVCTTLCFAFTLAESFCYVNYGSSIITSKVRQIISVMKT